MIKFQWVKDDRDEKIFFKSKEKKKKKILTKKKGTGLVLDWESALEWKGNPFKEKLNLPIHEMFAGRVNERKKLNLFFIHSSRFGSIRGGSGEGKSSLLTWLEYELQNFQKRYIISYLPSKELRYGAFLKKLVKPFVSFGLVGNKDLTSHQAFEVIRDKNNSSKEIVFLIDDFDELSDEHYDLMISLFKSMKNIRIIVTYTTKKHDLSPFGQDDIKVNLQGMKPEGLRDLLVHRIEHVGGVDIDPFTESLVKSLGKKSNHNPMEFLALCNKKAIDLSVGEDKEDDLAVDDLKDLEQDMARHQTDVEKSSASYESTVHVEEEIKPNSEPIFEGDKIVQEILASGSSKKKSSKVSKTTKKVAKKK